jgi:hypothetical protein
LKTKTFTITILTVFNLFLLFRIDFNTLVSVWIIALIFAVGIALGYLFGMLPKVRSYKHLIALVLVPGLINAFFLINFCFSTNTVSETYSIQRSPQRGSSYSNNTNTINLENATYSKYWGIRTFFDFDSMKYAKKITYYFEDGLLGLRVLKYHEFK